MRSRRATPAALSGTPGVDEESSRADAARSVAGGRISDEKLPAVLVLGTLCLDMFPGFLQEPRLAPGTLMQVGRLTMQPGGCVANTGLALAEPGSATALVADVGDDHLGETLVAQMSARGVDTSGIRRVAGLSTSCSVAVSGWQDRCIWHHPGANADFDGSGAGSHEATITHVGYPNLLGALNAAGGARLVGLLTQQRARGSTISLDLAVVDPLASAPVDWEAWLRRVVPVVDVLVPSRDDLQSAGLDASSAVGVARELLGMGAAVVAVKDSIRGIVLVTAGAARLASAGRAFAGRAHEWADLTLVMPAFEVVPRSTAGAGDAAVAGLLHGLATGLGPADSLRCAAAAAAARVEGGGKIPSWADLRSRIDAGWALRAVPTPDGAEVVAAAHPAGR